MVRLHTWAHVGVALAALLLTALPAFADEAVVVSVDRNDVYVGQQFLLVVTVVGEPGSEPTFPAVEGLEIDESGVMFGKTMRAEWTNGQMRQFQQYRWSFKIYARTPGRYTIPGITMMVDGQDKTSQPVYFDVQVAGRQTLRPSSRDRAAGGGSAAAKELTIKDSVTMETVVDHHDVYQGEAVVLTMRITELASMAVRVSRPAMMSFPKVAGFYSGPITSTARRETREGWNYEVTEHRQVLFATAPGTLTIPGAEYVARVRANTTQGPEGYDAELKSDPIEVVVKPLPEKPDNFSGAVGNFEVEGQLEKPSVPQGTPSLYIIRVRGRGNADGILAPQLPALAWAHVSEPEARTEHPNSADWTQIEKSFRYNITPHEIGTFEVPSQAFVYFDPKAARFETRQIAAANLNVVKSNESVDVITVGGQTGGPEAVKVASQELLPIMTELRPLQRLRPAPAMSFLAALLPPLAVLALYVALRRRRRLQDDPRYARNYFARSRSQQRLESVAAAKDPSEALYRAVVGYLADKFDVNEAGMTPEDVRRLLEAKEIEPALAENLVKILRSCERRRYAGGELQAQEVQALLSGAQAAMDRLDAHLAGRPA